MARFIQRRHAGRQQLRYEFEVDIHRVSELPIRVATVAVAMARGPKKYSTATVPVNSRRVEFSEKEGRIRLAASTVYRDAVTGRYDDKVYTVRVTLTNVNGSEVPESGPSTLSVSAPIELSKFIDGSASERLSLNVPFSSARNAPKLCCDMTIRARPVREGAEPAVCSAVHFALHAGDTCVCKARVPWAADHGLGVVLRVC